jgi:hypothetical protein
VPCVLAFSPPEWDGALVFEGISEVGEIEEAFPDVAGDTVEDEF